MDQAVKSSAPFRVGTWMPEDQHVLDSWIDKQLGRLSLAPQALLPVVDRLRELIETDPQVYQLFHEMFTQVPHKPPYNQDPTGAPQVRDYRIMLQLISGILTQAPEFNKTGLVGFPINAILDWSMGTSAGFAAFINPVVNRHLKDILCEWARFLDSADSCYVLGADPHTGWFGADAMKKMPGFVEDFACDPSLPHYGFTSWDDFFTRQFRPGRRPIAAEDDDNVIVNACESAPYRLARQVKERDEFWIKAQPYSVSHMLANDRLAADFVDGTIYQAFLSATSYHRWHSPVSGRIAKAYVVDGSYYSETLSEGFDPSGPNESQGYITEVATRALIFIEADNPAIGLMCFMAVGMAEVSSCDITVYEGQHVKKGQQLGMFHFGGSTHCLLFRPGVTLEFHLGGQDPGLDAHNIHVNARIATVGK